MKRQGNTKTQAGDQGTKKEIEMKKKTYLGDSVYAEINQSHQIVLTTENGFGPSNTVILEGEVYMALLAWVNSFESRSKPTDKGSETEGMGSCGICKCSASVWKDGCVCFCHCNP
jgi:hypothetical protein